VRPRDAWWPELQLRAGELLTDHLRRGAAPEAIAERLHELGARVPA
jgi:hypothetical protein